MVEKSGVNIPTQRRFNVHMTSSQRYGRCIDVEATLCAFCDLLTTNPALLHLEGLRFGNVCLASKPPQTFGITFDGSGYHK